MQRVGFRFGAPCVLPVLERTRQRRAGWSPVFFAGCERCVRGWLQQVKVWLQQVKVWLQQVKVWLQQVKVWLQ